MPDNSPPARTPEEVRQEIAAQREELVGAVDALRADFDITRKVRENLPAVAGGALAAGFVLAGGIGATMRLFARRSREGTERARVGPYTVIERS
jgi:Protein of unknown function (DUF3618)